MLVKDGKPCSSSSNSVSQQQVGGGTSNGSSGSGGSVSSINTLITGDAPHTHSPDTSSALLSYNGAVTGHNSQMLQQPCNNSLMSNSLAMAYRNQNNFMSNSHQQQCGGYLPLQGRAW